MSGTSLDGLDIAHCVLEWKSNRWLFNITHSETIHYSNVWKNKLQTPHLLNGFDLSLLNNEFGKFLGNETKKFIQTNSLSPDFVSSHGHTVFHQPEKQITVQIGNGAVLASHCNLPTVCDFRTTDIANGGQGAPLVPVGDALLFNTYDACINIGGFSNISFNNGAKRIAFDIGPANSILNYLCQKKNMDFDKDGLLARQGKVNTLLLTQLNAIDYFHKSFPKSLGREWVETFFIPLIEKHTCSIEDKLRTVTEQIAMQIATTLNSKKEILLTGGGAFNLFLIERINDLTSAKIVIPDDKLVSFKEALIFAFLGVLRWRNEINCLASVTGAKKDSSVGCIYLP